MLLTATSCRTLCDLPSGTVYEKATIELWLSTRGSICPITHEALTKEDLVEDKDLRNRSSATSSRR